jgi:hypothetical protein
MFRQFAFNLKKGAKILELFQYSKISAPGHKNLGKNPFHAAKSGLKTIWFVSKQGLTSDKIALVKLGI